MPSPDMKARLADLERQVSALPPCGRIEVCHRACLTLLYHPGNRKKLTQDQFNDLYGVIHEIYRLAHLADSLGDIIRLVRQVLNITNHTALPVLEYDSHMAAAQAEAIRIGRQAADRLSVLMLLLKPEGLDND